jgi:hypothetical protein
MTPDRIEHLLGGWAAGTLTADERGLLMREAARDQQLFNALADEEALRDALADPIFRARLRQMLGEPAAAQPSVFWSWLRKPWPLFAAAATLAGIALFTVITRWPDTPREPAVQMAQNRVSQQQRPPGEARPVSLPEAAPEQAAARREAAPSAAPAGQKIGAEGAQNKEAVEEKNADALLTAANERLDQAAQPPSRRALGRQRDELVGSFDNKKEKDAPAQVGVVGGARDPASLAPAAAAPPPPSAQQQVVQMGAKRASLAAPAESTLGPSALGGVAESQKPAAEKEDKLAARAASPPPPAKQVGALAMSKSEAAPQFIHHLERRMPNGDWVRTDASSLLAGDAIRISLLSPVDVMVTSTIESPGAPPRALQTGMVKAGERIVIPREGSLPSSPGLHRISIQSLPPAPATAVGFRSKAPSTLPSLVYTLEFK